jgi:hypothetical protein
MLDMVSVPDKYKLMLTLLDLEEELIVIGLAVKTQGRRLHLRSLPTKGA